MEMLEITKQFCSKINPQMTQTPSDVPLSDELYLSVEQKSGLKI